MINSKILLLGMLFCLILTPLCGNSALSSDSINGKKKELIIVSIDEEFISSSANLVNYIRSIYSVTDEDLITIKTYLHPDDKESQKIVFQLIEDLVNQGIPKDQISLVVESRFLSHPYFSLAVTENPAIQ